MPHTPYQHKAVTGIICTRFLKCARSRPATLLRDWKVKTKKSGTCDLPICQTCTTSPSPDKDLCQIHAEGWKVWQASRSG